MSERAAPPTALILVGGVGTRLRSVLIDRPKPMALVEGRPFLARILDQLVEAGISDAVLCTGHMGDRVQDEFGSAYGPLRLRYSHEPSPLGTGGALRLAASAVEGSRVLAMNGDSYFGLDLSAYLAWHTAQSVEASLAIREVDDVSRFGCVEADEAGWVTSFREKAEGVGSGWINGGIYLFSTPWLKGLPEGRTLSLEREVLPNLIGKLKAFRATGPFLDIGTPETLAQAARFFGQAGN